MTLRAVDTIVQNPYSSLTLVGVVVHAADGTIQFANTRALELLDLSADQIAGRSSLDPAWHVVREDESPFPCAEHPSAVALASGAPIRDVVMGVARPTPGDRIWLLVNAEPQHDARGDVSQVVVTFIDVSGIKQREQESRAALADSALLRLALDEVPAHVYTKDRNSRYTYANAPTLQLFGTTEDALRGKADVDFFPPDVVQRLRDVDQRVLAGERTREEIVVDQPDGSRRFYLEMKSPLEPLQPHAEVPGLLGISVDVTDMEQQRLRVARLSAFYATLARCYEVIARGANQQELFHEVCRAAVEVGGVAAAWVGIEEESSRRIRPVAVFGESQEYVNGLEISTDPDDPLSHGPTGTAFRTGKPFWLDDFQNSPLTRPWRERANASGWQQSAAVPILRGDRSVGVFTMYARGTDTFTPEVRQLLGDLARGLGLAMERIAADDARREVETTLRDSHRQYQELFDEMFSALMLAEVVTDSDGRIVDHRHLLVNRAFTALTGIPAEQFVGRLASETPQSPGQAPFARFYEVARTGIPFQYERFSPDYNKHLDVRVFSPKAGQFALSISDVSQRRTLEEQLRQAQKMESIGRLAGGIAHDFNNMLSVILGHTELALSQVPGNSEVASDLEEVMSAGRRSAELTGQLLTFARKQPIAPRSLNLTCEVAKSLKLLRRLITEDITVTTTLAEELWDVHLDPSYLDQILANLCVNARDAIRTQRDRETRLEHHREHRVTISTENVVLEHAHAADGARAAGEYVRLSVTDTGCGMTEATRARMFEPFFTTKVVGEGTGLGLSMVFGAVQQSGGFLEVESSPGAGTRFDVFLPRLLHAEEEVLETTEQLARGRGETVLVVEDDQAVLRLTERSLRQLGYTVLAARRPNEAIALLGVQPIAIDLLLTDVIMPQMNGRELAKVVSERYPDMKQLFMSGYTSDILEEAGSTGDDIPLVRKPFSLRDLAHAVRSALDTI